ncbi:MAG: cupin domain-containing protein [Candidatus Brocadiia bacterium]
MAIHVHEDEFFKKQPGGGQLIGAEQGATNGFCIGIAFYDQEVYGTPGVHDDQEGFYVLAGQGTAKVGDEEFEIRPGTAYIAQKGVPHSVKKRPGSKPVKLLWSHGAV